MTNREWLNSLTNKELARVIHQWKDCNFCEYEKVRICIQMDCEEGILEWLNKKHINPMPEIKVGDVIYATTKDHNMTMMCVHNGTLDTRLFWAEEGKTIPLHILKDGEIRKVYRYDTNKHYLTLIWRADK